jgi:hypothetical protein
MNDLLLTAVTSNWGDVLALILGVPGFVIFFALIAGPSNEQKVG